MTNKFFNKSLTILTKVVSMTPSLKWDGSDLGEILESQVVSRVYVEKDEYWTIEFSDQDLSGSNEDEVDKSQESVYVTCYVRSIVKNHANLVDELKPVFNLTKLGTHRAQYKNRKLLLVKPIIVDDTIVCDQKFNHDTCIIDSGFINQMQELYVFREFLGVSNTYDKSIRIRKVSSRKPSLKSAQNTPRTGNVGKSSSSRPLIRGYPISFHENSFHPERTDKVLPNTVLDKWFHNTTVNSVARRLLGVNSIEQIPECIFKLNSQIQDIVERVDRNLIEHVTHILDRVRNRLLYDD